MLLLFYCMLLSCQMTPADMALVHDPEFKKLVVRYAASEEQFFKDFSSAFSKVLLYIPPPALLLPPLPATR